MSGGVTESPAGHADVGIVAEFDGGGVDEEEPPKGRTPQPANAMVAAAASATTRAPFTSPSYESGVPEAGTAPRAQRLKMRLTVSLGSAT